MILRAPHHATGALRDARACQRGFSLVEIMMVVLIISLLGMFAVPTLQRVQRRSKAAAIVNDFRVFAAAFEAAAHQNGSWPAEAAAGTMPAGMTSDLKVDAWLRTTPMGGKYNWDNTQTHFGSPSPFRPQAAIAISATASAPLTLDVPMLLELEAAIDGESQASVSNLLTGNFRIGAGLCPLFIIQQ